MKPVKITAEITLTPEMFEDWCEGDLPKSPRMYQCYIEKILYSKFGSWLDIGGYEDFINKVIDDNKNGWKLTVEELNK